MRGKHPELTRSSVRCGACGHVFAVRSSRSEIVVEVCSRCHPAYTGVERATTSGSRTDRFERRRAQSRRSSVAA